MALPVSLIGDTIFFSHLFSFFSGGERTCRMFKFFFHPDATAFAFRFLEAYWGDFPGNFLGKMLGGFKGIFSRRYGVLRRWRRAKPDAQASFKNSKERCRRKYFLEAGEAPRCEPNRATQRRGLRLVKI